MNTKFEKNDKVKIKSHGDKSYVGKTGIITNVVPVIKEKGNQVMDIPYVMECDVKDYHTTGFYLVMLDNENEVLPGFAFDTCLEKINDKTLL
jgi:hypothetical protein